MIFLSLFTAIFVLKEYIDGHFRSMEAMRTYVGQSGLFTPLILTAIQTLQVVLPVLPDF